MKILATVLLAGLMLGCGCVDLGPAVSKSSVGNLELNLSVGEGLDATAACIYIDDVFIGNVSNRFPILQLKRGRHTIRVELEGAVTYQQAITILGEPNHQVLNATLKKK